MLETDNLLRNAAGRPIVDHISLKLGAGEIGALLGPSGSGKSSLLRLIMGLDRADGGRVTVDGRLLSGPGVHVPPEERGISLIFQDFTLFPHLSVLKNLTFGQQGRGPDLDEILDMLEIAHLKKRGIGALSGGEQQRVAIARSLAAGPRLLLLDEPFSNVDNMLKDRLYERFASYLKRAGITAILATHDHNEAFFFSDRIFVMRAGALIDTNTPEGIYHRPKSTWVAEFFGSANLVTEQVMQGLGARVADGVYLVRPEMLVRSGSGVDATVERKTFYGFYADLVVEAQGGQRLLMRGNDFGDVAVGDTIRLRLKDGVDPYRIEGKAGQT